MIQVLVAPQDVAAALAGAGEAFAALQDCAAASFGLMGSKKLASSPFRAFQLRFARLPNGELACWLCRCQPDLGSAHGLARGAVEQKTRALCCREPLQHGACSPPCPPSSVLPCQHQDPVVSRLMAPLFCLFFSHVSCEPRGASWHSETGREESWDLHCFRCGRPLCWDFYNQQIRGGVKASLVRSQGMN